MTDGAKRSAFESSIDTLWVEKLSSFLDWLLVSRYFIRLDSFFLWGVGSQLFLISWVDITLNYLFATRFVLTFDSSPSVIKFVTLIGAFFLLPWILSKVFLGDGSVVSSITSILFRDGKVGIESLREGIPKLCRCEADLRGGIVLIIIGDAMFKSGGWGAR